jgi:very-short-patch-repair endonuclease
LRATLDDFPMSVQRARHLRRSATEWERLMWRALRGAKRQGFHFRRQAPIGSYFADFACHSAKIVVELDGSQHAEPSAIAHDTERTAFLESRGYRVLRFSNIDAISNLDSVFEYIIEQCKMRLRPPPEPLPR